ncbi:BRISC complex subunit FAM175B-like [Agrilus planipennis]|uniref:BRISC complex subunit FAM175B-like n=1 Tax=Agrilus planipennis TaxID=224129 RepID=A0A1W4X318_AGRPL|nr:BRISC complex subunit FAM175B-like [Agrilus planipennis]
MVETVSVSISGFAFSLLLYENVKCNYDQEGFLLGEIAVTERSKVTDADQEVVSIDKVIRINSILPCPQQCSFYNRAGKVDIQRLNELLGENATKVVAWYKYKKINGFKLTLREKIIHKQLVDLFGDLFSMCVLMCDSSENFSTHSFYQTFIRYYDGCYQGIPLHIVNLSQKNDCYKVAETLPEEFNKIVSSLNIDLETSQGLVVVSKIQEALQKHIDHLVLNLDESEKELFELEEEVKQLKQNLMWKRQYSCSVDNHLNSDLINGTEENINSDNSSNILSQTVTNISEQRTKHKGSKSAKKDVSNTIKKDSGWINMEANITTRSRSRTSK